MSIISDEYQFIFLHVAKTGGRSINQSLRERLGDEGQFFTAQINSDINTLDRMLGLEAKDLAGEEKWHKYFKFAFIRSPYDRAVSIYENIMQDYKRNLDNPRKRQTDKGKLLESILSNISVRYEDFTFDIFCTAVLRDRALDNYHWDKQVNAVTDGKGSIIFDFLGRYENLQMDFDIACENSGLPKYQLPHYNKTRRKDLNAYLTPVAKNILNQVYADDFEALGYDVP